MAKNITPNPQGKSQSSIIGLRAINNKAIQTTGPMISG